MFNGERPRTEKLEAETNPETVVNKATREIVERVEIQETVGSDASPEAVQKALKFFSIEENWKSAKGIGRFGVDIIGVGIHTAAKMVWNLLKFAKKAIEKKGNITFREGYELGKDIFSFDDKDKK